ncbi:unnamed protein product [Brassica rapa]|uniref:Uncharacterized protein n=1 Tax=Brassica campestris TaxID=3711 RepID=A0A8D9GTE3_BRACM|nr:unnamed protein product [Brassica rapa]
MPIMDKKEADMLMESLALCFKNSWTKERSVSYVRKKYGRLFTEDIIKRGFDILTKNKIRDPKYGEGNINIISLVEKDILMESLDFCLKHSFSKANSVSYVTNTHAGLFEEDKIKQMFDIMNKIKMRNLHYQGEAMSKKDVLIQSLVFCFKQYFTEAETLNYIAKYHGGLFEECMIKRVFATISSNTKNRDPHYEADVAARSSFRKLLTQEHAWTQKEKMKLIEDRLSLLCQETRDLVGNFSRLEKEILGFFITKFPEEVIDKVLHELDIAEGNQEITLEIEKEEEVVEVEKGGGRKTQSGKRKARGRK